MVLTCRDYERGWNELIDMEREYARRARRTQISLIRPYAAKSVRCLSMRRIARHAAR